MFDEGKPAELRLKSNQQQNQMISRYKSPSCQHVQKCNRKELRHLKREGRKENWFNFTRVTRVNLLLYLSRSRFLKTFSFNRKDPWIGVAAQKRHVIALVAFVPRFVLYIESNFKLTGAVFGLGIAVSSIDDSQFHKLPLLQFILSFRLGREIEMSENSNAISF